MFNMKSATKRTLPLKFDTFYEFLELQFLSMCDIGVNMLRGDKGTIVVQHVLQKFYFDIAVYIFNSLSLGISS